MGTGIPQTVACVRAPPRLVYLGIQYLVLGVFGSSSPCRPKPTTWKQCVALGIQCLVPRERLTVVLVPRITSSHVPGCHDVRLINALMARILGSASCRK